VILTVTLNPAIDKLYQVDNFTVGSVFRPRNMWVTAGGKGINVAKVAAILGEKVIATGFLGGKNGQFISEQLEQLGIINKFVQIAGETRTCTTINDSLAHTFTGILEPGPTISISEQNCLLDNFQTLVSSVELVIISGSLPQGVSSEFYGEMIKIAKAQGKKVILDTSGSVLINSLSYSPLMIKPNREELESIVGKSLKEDQILKIAKEIADKYNIEIVCVTLGESGCIAVTEAGHFYLRGPKVEPINTVGSGDSFVAGCTVALVQNQTIEQVLKMGMACGTANTQFAEAGKVSKGLVEKYLQLISIVRD